VYSIFQPEVATELGQQKAKNLTATGAEIIASPNPGCALQIQKHLPSVGVAQVPSVLHPVQLLDRSIRGERLAVDG
jgi:glycolate oxidase iron-sulfur subunit